MTRLSVFIASSIDGYIATLDDKLDWLDAAAVPDEDYGYEPFISTVDALAMGRGTYDFISHIDPLPFGDRKVFVFTHNPPQPREGVIFWQTSPREALARWEEMGIRHVYVDGGQVISSFLAEGLVDDMVLTKVPLTLGEGRPLFHPIPLAGAWMLTDVTSWPSGMVNLTYSRA